MIDQKSIEIEKRKAPWRFKMLSFDEMSIKKLRTDKEKYEMMQEASKLANQRPLEVNLEIVTPEEKEIEKEQDEDDLDEEGDDLEDA